MIGELDILAAKILIVDDEPANTLLLERVLDHAGYRNVKSTTDSRHVVSMYLAFEPDIVLLDLLMPHLDGFEVMEQLAARRSGDEYMPVLVLTADVGSDALQRSLAGGATDFLTKPFDQTEALLRIGNLIETRLLHQRVRAQNEVLDRRVEERTREVELAHVEMLDRLALAAELRDDETGQHTRRVGRGALVIARTMGRPEDEVRLLGRAAMLHDVGKIGVPDSILLKPAKLTSEEFERVKEHAAIGAKILSGGRFPLLRMAETIALFHHERWDGTGYGGVAGEEIPLPARITSVADVFDALTHRRPYKDAWPKDEALEEIRDQRGRQFDPNVVDAFLENPELGLELQPIEGFSE